MERGWLQKSAAPHAPWGRLNPAGRARARAPARRRRVEAEGEAEVVGAARERLQVQRRLFEVHLGAGREGGRLVG